MTNQSTSPRATAYGSVARTLHWLSAILILAGWGLAELADEFPKQSAERAAIVSWHAQAGIAVLILLLARVPWNLAHRVALAHSSAPQWTLKLAALVKWALYVLLLAAPIAGLATLQARGDAVQFLGIALPDVFGGFSAWRKPIKEFHEWLGDAILTLATLHAAAALWHHFVLRDDVLRRMLRPR